MPYEIIRPSVSEEATKWWKQMEGKTIERVDYGEVGLRVDGELVGEEDKAVIEIAELHFSDGTSAMVWPGGASPDRDVYPLWREAL